MVAKAVAASTVLLALFIFISGYMDISRVVIISSGMLNVIGLSGWRYLKRRLVLSRAAEGIGVSRILIVGTGRMGTALGKWLEGNRQLGYLVCGFLDSKPSTDPQVLGTVDDLRNIALKQFIDEMFITLPADRDLVKKAAAEARELGLGLKLVPDLYDGLGWRAPLHMIGGFPVMDLHLQPIPAVGLAAKRLLDVIFAAGLLLLSTPLLVLIAALIKCDSPGPVFYWGDRIGRKGKRFRCYKFRSMVVDADVRKDKLREANEREGPFFKLENDPRVTRVGRWLRKSSLDELTHIDQRNSERHEFGVATPTPRRRFCPLLY
jgi:Bacterial sugar transferase/CoA-binding domain